MRARAVIGASFGDEGKGLVTDYLCGTQGAGIVVRFNGGAQAGHTVVTPEGKRHVFSHFGSGTLCGVPTFLSQFFICNPILFFGELTRLQELGVNPVVYAHPNCLISTFADMMINQQLENDRGDKRHGSCGVGVNETIMRSAVPELTITMSDLWNGTRLEGKLAEICGKYAEFRCGRKVDDAEAMIQAFIERCAVFAEAVHPLGIAQCPDPVFEGAQGLLLDEYNKQFFPHVTRSRTGMTNVRLLCAQAGISEIDTYYVSRTYLTRHGAGPLPGEDTSLRFNDDTNVENPYQGAIRFAPLDVGGLRERCEEDAGSRNYKLVLTHCDQLPEPCEADLYFDGPSRAHARLPVKAAA
ncbi:MAG: adenylosuccinate synthetase [Acetobacteraceae bacterium]